MKIGDVIFQEWKGITFRIEGNKQLHNVVSFVAQLLHGLCDIL